MKPVGVLFDFDGTLVNTVELGEQAILEAFDAAGITTSDQLLRLVRRGESIDSILSSLDKDPALETGIADTRYRVSRHLLQTEAAWYPDALETVDTLKGKRPIGLVTNAGTGHVEMAGRRIGVHDRFTTIVGKEHVGMLLKPFPFGLELAAKQLGLAGQPMAYVGDLDMDVYAAKSARMRAWHVRRKHTAQITALMADLAVDDMREFLKHL